MNGQLVRRVQISERLNYARRRRSTSTESRSIYVSKKDDFRGSFFAVLCRWHNETEFISNPDVVTDHPSFYAIVENASLVLDLIKDELASGNFNLVWVLEDYYEMTPYAPDDAGNMRQMADRWIAVLEERGH